MSLNALYLYNPTSEDVQARWDGKDYLIRSGEIVPFEAAVATQLAAKTKNKEQKTVLELLQQHEVSITRRFEEGATAPDETPAEKPARGKKAPKESPKAPDEDTDDDE